MEEPPVRMEIEIYDDGSEPVTDLYREMHEMERKIGGADPKPEGRVRDPQLLKVLHLEWRECCLCRANDQLSLHHINKHPRDDIRGNLVMVCGSGTTGCHGLIEARNSEKLTELGDYILKARGDTIVYLYDRMGPVAAQEWMKRNLLRNFL